MTLPTQNPDQVEIMIDQPTSVEMYYGSCARINQHNRKRQDDLLIKKKLGMHNWSK